MVFLIAPNAQILAFRQEDSTRVWPTPPKTCGEAITSGGLREKEPFGAQAFLLLPSHTVGLCCVALRPTEWEVIAGERSPQPTHTLDHKALYLSSVLIFCARKHPEAGNVPPDVHS